VRKILTFFVLVIVSLACALPGISAPAEAPLPTFDSNSVEIMIAETAAAAQTQTALKIPTATHTPKPTHTPSITPTPTPTFFFSLVFTPIPTFTLPVTVSAGDGAASGEDEGEEGKKEKRDPRTMTGKEWTCSVLYITPPKGFVFGPNVRFNVKWTLFNTGTKAWPNYGVDLVYEGGLRHEGTKIQDFGITVPPGGEIQVGAVFITPNKEGDFSTFFRLQVGKREFCHLAYYFSVVEK
jgi:Ig-like domain from next to BRCA1 gene